MKTLPRSKANAEWDNLWSNLTTEWFKVEVLQDYYSEDKGASLDAWMNGDEKCSMELLAAEPTEWANDCRSKVESGIKLIRIHVVDYPLSDYMRWEVELYKRRNIPIGKEAVYLVDRRDIPSIDLPDGDMMMFDRTNVVVGNYDDTGYAETQTFYDSADDISPFLNLRSALLDAPLVKVRSNSFNIH